MSYDKINKVKKGVREDVFAMAVSYLLDKGYDFCSSLTDEDIEEVDGSAGMSKEFVQGILRLSRDIAQAEDKNPVEIIQFCAAEDVFDLHWFCGKLRRDGLVTLIGYLLQNGNIDEEELREWYDIDDDDWGMLKDEMVQCGF